MRLYENVQLRLFYALPISHFISLPPALINNVLGMKVNVCDEKCITSWKKTYRRNWPFSCWCVWCTALKNLLLWMLCSFAALRTKPLLPSVSPLLISEIRVCQIKYRWIQMLCFIIVWICFTHFYISTNTCCIFVISDSGRTLIKTSVL